MIFINSSGCAAAASRKHGKRPHRLAGPGQRPFTPSTAVQIRLGTPTDIKGCRFFLLLGRKGDMPRVPFLFKATENIPHTPGSSLSPLLYRKGSAVKCVRASPVSSGGLAMRRPRPNLHPLVARHTGRTSQTTGVTRDTSKL